MRRKAWIVLGGGVLAAVAIGAWAQDGQKTARKPADKAPLPIVPRGPRRPVGPGTGDKLLPPDVPIPRAIEATYKGGKIRLPASPKTGRYHMTIARQISQTVGKGESARKYWQSLTLSGRLVVAPPGAGGRADRTFRCERITHLVGTPDGPRRYESAGPPDSQDPGLVRLWTPLRGWQGTRTVTADGRTDGLRGLGVLARAAPSSTHSSPSPELLRWIAASVLDELGVGWWGQLLPGEPVGPGSRWDARVYLPTEPPLGVVEVPMHCLLQDVVTEDGRRLARIDFSGSRAIMASRVGSRWAPNAPDVQIRRAQLAVTGQVRVDLDSGLAASIVLNLRGRAITVLGREQGRQIGVSGEFVSEQKWTVSPEAPPAAKGGGPRAGS